MGAWAPPPLRVDDGAHLHPQATKHKEKKKRELRLIKLVLLNSPLLKLQALHSSSSKLTKPKLVMME
jgi:hypothetical protein